MSKKLIDRAIETMEANRRSLMPLQSARLYDHVIRALKKAKKDSERLDWLSTGHGVSLDCPGVNDFDENLGWRLRVESTYLNGMGDKTPRQAIDAAMKAERRGSD